MILFSVLRTLDEPVLAVDIAETDLAEGVTAVELEGDSFVFFEELKTDLAFIVVHHYLALYSQTMGI